MADIIYKWLSGDDESNILTHVRQRVLRRNQECEIFSKERSRLARAIAIDFIIFVKALFTMIWDKRIAGAEASFKLQHEYICRSLLINHWASVLPRMIMKIANIIKGWALLADIHY